ncbi:hypothetical protein N7492_005413 [Penicillium capsulatum]|uniref:INO80 complex subunit F domain-containing protein n=1 Tax=Penicillium capsulatum TaxID=69766 RepID=A0A9W9IC74_9EURO|nr:hypothetical protein N7492_005413 [Penicillium capsulatum]
MENRPSAHPPSVEIAYKRKCIALKRRLAEVEAENELMRTRNRRGWQYIQKMRLESCMLLERLAKVTGMADEAQSGAADPELRARAAAMMSNSASLNGMAGPGHAGENVYLDDETDGSSDEQPPTPEERPLRVKRSRKSNANNEPGAEEDAPVPEHASENADRDPAGSSLPRLAPAPSQQDLTSSFRVQPGSNGSAHEGEQTPAAASTHSHENREAQAEQVAAESGPTPMDMDTKEPKVEAS